MEIARKIELLEQARDRIKAAEIDPSRMGLVGANKPICICDNFCEGLTEQEYDEAHYGLAYLMDHSDITYFFLGDLFQKHRPNVGLFSYWFRYSEEGKLARLNIIHEMIKELKQEKQEQ